MSDFKRYFLLNEISESNLKLIASNIPPEDLPFNNIFGDKYRIEEEFMAVHPIISQLQNSFKGVYDIDIQNGTIKRKNSNNSQKLSKFLSKEYKKIFDENFENIKRNFRFDKQDPTGYFRDIFHEYAKENNITIRKSTNHQYKDWLMVTDNFDSKEQYQKFKEWLHYLNKNPNLYKILYNNPKVLWQLYYNFDLIDPYSRQIIGAMQRLNKLIVNYHIIYSRHPIDILRMSDYQGIQSCHSQGGGYFECAVQEANQGGLIAYLVNDKQFKQINNLQAKEIFSDSERNIEGIQPDGRIRLRLYKSPYDQMILIPENVTYGKHSRDNIGEEFHNKVLEWSKNVQGIDENFELDDNRDGEVDLDNWELIGGYYEDTSSREMFYKMFPDVKFTGEAVKFTNVRHNNGEMNQQNIWMHEMMHMYHFFLNQTNNYFYIEFDVEENEGGLYVTVPQTIFFIYDISLKNEIKFKYKFNDDYIDDDFPEYEVNLHKNIIKTLLKFSYLDDDDSFNDDINIIIGNDNLSVEINHIHFDSPDEFRDYLSSLKEIYDSKDKIIKKIKDDIESIKKETVIDLVGTKRFDENNFE